MTSRRRKSKRLRSSKRDLDRSLLRENLRLSVSERMVNFLAFARFA